MSELPQGWSTCKAGDIFEIVGGGTPPSADGGNFSEAGTAHAWLTPADLSGYKKKHISRGARDLSDKGLHSSSAKVMPAGSVLFTSRAPIGYVAISSGGISTNQGFKSFVLPEGLDPSYVYYYLKSIRDLAESRGTGTTFKELSGAATKELPFVVAPIAEQKRIAQKLDALLAQVDTLKSRIDTIPALLRRFRQSVLNAAVSGRLANTSRPSSSPEVLIHTNKRVQPVAAEELAHALEITGEKFPDQWPVYALEQLVDPERGIPYGIVQTGEHIEGGVPTVRCGDIKQLEVDITSLKKVAPRIEASYRRTRLKGGEILLAIRGSVGNTAIAPSSLAGFNISREVAMIPCIEDVDASFVALTLQSQRGQQLLAGKTRGVAQKGINLADVRRLPIALPPLATQGKIVHCVEQLFGLVDQLEARVGATQKRIDALTQSLLAKAFRGELVPQDPNDEPASVLLERIVAQRSAAPKPTRGRKATTS